MTIEVQLNPDQYKRFSAIADKEFRQPEDQARLIISEYIQDYNGTY